MTWLEILIIGEKIFKSRPTHMVGPFNNITLIWEDRRAVEKAPQFRAKLTETSKLLADEVLLIPFNQEFEEKTGVAIRCK